MFSGNFLGVLKAGPCCRWSYGPLLIPGRGPTLQAAGGCWKNQQEPEKHQRAKLLTSEKNKVKKVVKSKGIPFTQQSLGIVNLGDLGCCLNCNMNSQWLGRRSEEDQRGLPHETSINPQNHQATSQTPQHKMRWNNKLYQKRKQNQTNQNFRGIRNQFFPRKKHPTTGEGCLLSPPWPGFNRGLNES